MSDLEKFTATAMRGPRKGIWEQLAAAKLVKANRTSDRLERVICVCEAARFCKGRVENPNVDWTVVDHLYNVAVALASVKPVKHVLSIHRWTGKPYEWVWKYPVRWGFRKNQQNYSHYIQPWFLETDYPEYLPMAGTSIETYRVYKTRVLCSNCKTELFDLFRTEAKEYMKLVEEKFKDQIKEEKMLLITGEKYEHDKEYYSEEEHWRRQLHKMPYEFQSYKPYVPPHLVIRSFPCPKCGERVVLETTPVHGSHYKYEDTMLKKVEMRLNRLRVEDYDYLKPEWRYLVFYEVSRWLTEGGLQQLVNQFLRYAAPIVDELEAKISDVISPHVFLDLYRKAEEEEEEQKREGEMGPGE